MAEGLIQRALTTVLLLNLALLPVRNSHGAEPKPERNRLEVAIAATGPLYLPIILANEAGYFSKRRVTINISILSATASPQALLSCPVDTSQSPTPTIHAHWAGSAPTYSASP